MWSTAELSSCNRDHVTCEAKEIYYLTLYRMSLQTLDNVDVSWGSSCVAVWVFFLSFPCPHLDGFPPPAAAGNIATPFTCSLRK